MTAFIDAGLLFGFDIGQAARKIAEIFIGLQRLLSDLRFAVVTAPYTNTNDYPKSKQRVALLEV